MSKTITKQFSKDFTKYKYNRSFKSSLKNLLHFGVCEQDFKVIFAQIV